MQQCKCLCIFCWVCTFQVLLMNLVLFTACIVSRCARGYVVMWLLEQCCRLPVSLGLIHFAVIWTPKIADDKNYSPVISDHNYSLWVFRLENSAWYKHFWLKIFAFAKFFRNPDGWSTVSVVVVPDHSRNMEVLENPLYRLGGISQTRVWLNAVTVSLCEVF